jgi:transposase
METDSGQVHVDAADVEIVARVAAIDVAKDSGMVCTRVPDPVHAGKRITRVWSVPSRTRTIVELAKRLASEGIERVVLEATSDYWRPFYYLLEAQGLTVWLVNARDVKNVPGRPKTDKLDAVWLAKLNERGMLRASFVPPVEIRRLRDYTRLRTDLTRERTRHIQRLEKLLEDSLIKLSSVATDIMGVSGRAMIAALIAGERDPLVLAGLAKGRMRAKHAALIDALTGRFDAHHGELASILLDQIDGLTAQVEHLDARIDELIAAIPAAQAHPSTSHPDGSTPPAYLAAVDRLDEITGIGRHAAQSIIAEVGLSMTTFPTSAHLVSWAKISPRTVQSGAKTRSGRTGKGNPYLKAAIGEAAASAARTRTFLGARFRRLAKRIGKMKALVAVARSILVIVWHLLNDPCSRYRDLGPEFFDNRIRPERRKLNHIRQLEALGYTVTLTPAA